ncbi:PqqD family protein [Curtanaerobium respiraculi]|uniref:PqqD family protein n=1 Tax=Curtanaerobium respiraculi TaxID=2949669 RepID=UPI0024B32668|nr:PqqD family protein [Curtanaerobium respiraculi]
MARSADNFLDYVPRHNALVGWHEFQGRVVVEVANRGFFNRFAQIVAKAPRTSHIELDEFGSFVWKCMDGTRTVFDIGGLVREEFGQKAEPLYPRLAKFVELLHANGYIVYENKIKK